MPHIEQARETFDVQDRAKDTLPSSAAAAATVQDTGAPSSGFAAVAEGPLVATSLP